MKITFFSIICVALITAASTAHAQDCPVPIATSLHWTTTNNGTAVFVDVNGNPVPADIVGQGDFLVVGCECPTWTYFLMPQNFEILGQTSIFGTLTLSLDPSRQSSTATRFMDDVARDGTHIEDLYFYATATVQAFPGKTFYSDREIHFRGKGILTFIPHRNEIFSSTERVDFIDPDNGNTVFSLTNADITLNP